MDAGLSSGFLGKKPKILSMIIIKAKFAGKCANTGKPIKKGELCYYDRFQKKVFSIDSVPLAPTDATDPAAGMIQDNENLPFDLFSNQNP